MGLLKRIEKKTDQGKPGKGETRRKASKADAAARQRIAVRIDIGGWVEKRLCQELGVETLSDELLASKGATLRELAAQFLHEEMEAILTEQELVLARAERRRLEESIFAELFGYGPLEPLLNDPEITEVFIFAPDRIGITRKGLFEISTARFESNEHLRRIIERIAAVRGQRFDADHPMLNLRLPDGSRLAAACPPVSAQGPVATLRKLSPQPLTAQNLIDFGTATPELMEFLRACVIARFNIVISGNHRPGKTTLLNVLAGFIPDYERVVTVENSTELRLSQSLAIALECPLLHRGRDSATIRDLVRQAILSGAADQSPITMTDLVHQALALMADRVIVGELRGGEALDLIQAMNSGHCAMTTLHSHSPRETLQRLETMVLMAGMDLPVRAIREQIAAAVHLVVHLDRLRDGSRKITRVSEVQGMEGDVITMSDLFMFEQTGLEGERVIGHIKPTGLRPKHIDKILDAGLSLPPRIFGIGQHS